MTTQCPECGTPWIDGITCTDHFHQFLFWEQEPGSTLGSVHHLMVLSYYLQHPQLYSPQGLMGAMQLLNNFLGYNATPAQMRAQNRDLLNSAARTYKITGTAESFGRYAHPVRWTMTATDVITGGKDHYIENITAWARSILESLRESGNL
jgi:hypothetical protein